MQRDHLLGRVSMEKLDDGLRVMQTERQNLDNPETKQWRDGRVDWFRMLFLAGYRCVRYSMIAFELHDDDNAKPIHWHVSLHKYTVKKTMRPA